MGSGEIFVFVQQIPTVDVRPANAQVSFCTGPDPNRWGWSWRHRIQWQDGWENVRAKKKARAWSRRKCLGDYIGSWITVGKSGRLGRPFQARAAPASHVWLTYATKTTVAAPVAGARKLGTPMPNIVEPPCKGSPTSMSSRSSIPSMQRHTVQAAPSTRAQP